MRTRSAVGVMIWALVVAAASAAWAEDKSVTVTKIRGTTVWLYDCADPTKRTEHPSADVGDLPRQARVLDSQFLQLTVRNGESKCVKVYAVETDQRIPIPKAECGPREASPGAAAVRNVGEGCKGGPGGGK